VGVFWKIDLALEALGFLADELFGDGLAVDGGGTGR